MSAILDYTGVWGITAVVSLLHFYHPIIRFTKFEDFLLSFNEIESLLLHFNIIMIRIDN